MGLEHITYEVMSWRHIPKKGTLEKGAQVDLLFDRDDGCITICELKYCSSKFTIDKAYAKELKQKLEVFEEHYPCKNKQVFLYMLTTNGIKKNTWSEGLVDGEVLIEDLF